MPDNSSRESNLLRQAVDAITKKLDEIANILNAPRKDKVFFRDIDGNYLIISKMTITRANVKIPHQGSLPTTLTKGAYIADNSGQVWEVVDIFHLLSNSPRLFNETYIILGRRVHRDTQMTKG